jgi:predicted aspartyl protease
MKVRLTGRVENWIDVMNAEKGSLDRSQVRGVEISEAIVSTDKLMLELPVRLIARLGLRQSTTRRSRGPTGMVVKAVFGPVRLTIEDRDCTAEVCEADNDCDVLIGRLPLMCLDFVIDPVNQCLTGNPEHGGRQILEIFPALVEG